MTDHNDLKYWDEGYNLVVDTEVIRVPIPSGKWRYLRVACRNTTAPRGAYTYSFVRDTHAIIGGGLQLTTQAYVISQIEFVRVTHSEEINIKHDTAVDGDIINVTISGAYLEELF